MQDQPSGITNIPLETLDGKTFRLSDALASVTLVTFLRYVG